MAIKIIQAGLFTTVQDLGRKGYESYGFSEIPDYISPNNLKLAIKQLKPIK